MKILMPLAFAVVVSFPVGAQDLGRSLLLGLGSSAMEKGGELIEGAPEKFDDFMKSTVEGREFSSNSACLGFLQVSINAGTVMANILSFSSVKIFEDSRGPVAQFRMLINGEKLHVEAFCSDSAMKAAILPWGSGSESPRKVSKSSLDAVAGLLLLLEAQGAFDREASSSEPIQSAETPKPKPISPELSEPAKGRNLETNGVPDELDHRLAAPTAPYLPSEASLSPEEKQAFLLAVSACWTVGSLSSEALRTTVTVEMAMKPDGTPIAGSIQLASSFGGSEAAVTQAFEAARRSIIRCGARGFPLPAEKFDAWKEMTLMFNAERMRIE
ncbi:hypothetical protein [Sulfitobacter sp. HGT1]|uniref:hypothetical protein n=1 Tax=Sulfitobacter sp. HGT1 TaxID=2735435 RepID=UPI001592B146|nr:hypothetical protein [Sulfitobacter sp. HGT1]